MKLRIDTQLLIDGIGGKHTNQSVVCEDGKITFVGSSDVAPVCEEVMDTPVLMPGMWECHTHFTGFTRPDIEQAATISPAEAAARATWDLKELLLSGFTSVREVGGLGVYLKPVVDEGTIPGPNIYASGRLLSTTAGHGDIHNMKLELVDRLGEMSIGRLADGPVECMRAVREQIRLGADAIKICTSGGVMSKIDNPIDQQFTLEEIRAITSEAARSRISVAAHCHGALGIKAAIEGGVHTIEHGTYLTEDLADQMKEKGMILVSTRYVVEKLKVMAQSPSMPEYAREKALKITDIHEESMRIAIRKGVPMALGTDIFVSGSGHAVRHGENAMELKYHVDLGMSPMDAIVMATSMGPKTLGERAPKSGQITIGYDADLLLLDANPLDDITVLTKREHIRVLKGGKLVS